MKYSLFILAICTGMAVKAQTFREQLTPLYNFMAIMNYNGFDNVSNEKPKPESKYRSYKRQMSSSDKSTWKDMDSTACFYDAQMKKTMEIIFKYDTKWKKFGKREYKYDPAGYPLACITYRWKEDEKLWNYGTEKSYAIDTLKRQIITEGKYKDNNDQWAYADRNVYLCNASGDDTTHIRSKWDKEANEYIGESRECRQYDTARHLIYSRIDGYDQKDKRWYISWVKHSSYDVNGNEVMEYDESMSKDGWSQRTLDSTYYDSQNRPTIERFYNMEAKDSSEWLMSYLHIFTYSNPNNPKDYTETQWSRQRKADTLKLWSRESKEYDIHGNLINRQLMHPTHTGEWWTTYHDSSVYDQNDNILYHLGENNRQGLPSASIQTFYYYFPYALGSIDNGENSSGAMLYPNPSSGGETNLKFNASDNSSVMIKIIDQSGRTIFSENKEVIQGENTLKISYPNLASGIYEVEATDLRSGAMGSFKWIVK